MEPWGYDWERFQTNAICAMIANRHRGKKEKTYKPDDFIPPRQKHTKNYGKQSWQEQFGMWSTVMQKIDDAKKGKLNGS